MIDQIIAIIKTNPTPSITAIAGFLGACIALIGALIVAIIKNWHDRKLAREQREMSLRKEIFLEMAEELVRNQKILTSFGNVEVSFNERIELKNKGLGTAGKVQLIASNKTIVALSKASSFHAKKYLELAELHVDCLLKRKDYERAQDKDPNSPQTREVGLAFLCAHLGLIDICTKVACEYDALTTDVIIAAREELGLMNFDPAVYKYD